MSVPRLNPFKDLLSAIVLLTRIPLPQRLMSDLSEDINASVWAFPIVGVMVAGFGALGYGLAITAGLPSMVSAIIAFTCMVLLSGAFHEDGLADVADGFGGGRTVERKLEIMRDSRIGAYGMIAIVLSLGLRVGGLEALSISQAVPALIIAGVMSRLMMVWTMRYVPPARKDGLAHDAGRPRLGRTLLGTLVALSIAAALVDPQSVLISLCLAAAACFMMVWIAKRQIGGFTGDVLGAVQQLSEIAVLLGFVIVYA